MVSPLNKFNICSMKTLLTTGLTPRSKAVT